MYGSDHELVTTEVSLRIQHSTPPRPRKNFQKVDWERFQAQLQVALPDAKPITTQTELEAAARTLVISLNQTIERLIPTVRYTPGRSKR